MGGPGNTPERLDNPVQTNTHIIGLQHISRVVSQSENLEGDQETTTMEELISPRVVYTPRYNIGFYGLERLHPFDSRKYGRAWRQLKKHFGASLRDKHVRPNREVTQDELLLVHSEAFLLRLKDSKYLASALEIPVLRRLPAWVIDWHVLRPMRWGTRGTILAAAAALKCGLAVNLSGGYHHAKPDHSEGFSIYADAAIAVAALRKNKLIGSDARIAYIDTDAHQGNGVCHAFMDDSRTFIFDIFNSQIYPAYDWKALDRVDCRVGITSSCTDSEYMGLLKSKLPGFLDSVANSDVGLAIYNAGTDVYELDPLGGLGISREAILKRDLFVVEELRKRSIPTVMLLSGGYTRESFQLVTDSVMRLLQ